MRAKSKIAAVVKYDEFELLRAQAGLQEWLQRMNECRQAVTLETINRAYRIALAEARHGK
jgi:hypothetical protein